MFHLFLHCALDAPHGLGIQQPKLAFFRRAGGAAGKIYLETEVRRINSDLKRRMSATGLKGLKELVYIVDDEELLGQLANTVLTEVGYRTRCFVDPVEVLRAVRDDGARPDLLVTDFVMGTMTGLELIEECKKLHPGMRTILLSGTVSESFIHKFAVQPDHFLPKPYPVSAFVRVVDDALHEKRA